MITAKAGSTVLIAAAMAVVVWAGALWINRRRVERYDGRGDPQCGVVVSVEPVRWLFIVWAFNAVCRALRRAGCGHAVYLYRWSRAAGSLLVLPDLMRRHRLDAKATRLAGVLEELARGHPEVDIHVIAYSTGVYVAFGAVKRLPPGIRVGHVIALHGTVSPGYDVAGVTKRSTGVLNVHGRVDFLINGLAPLLFGTNDRIHSPACGMVGLRRAAPGLEQRRWRPGDARFGYFGDHFTVASSAWLREHVVPRLA
jgi:hypothetical protein